jgi:hypothetical protein
LATAAELIGATSPASINTSFVVAEARRQNYVQIEIEPFQLVA